ncbi:TPR repeat protein [Penicillium angulare]|uniref:TPR repeat protein n=1 Tax=Penicillium angulare TaxID=116970 RepID=UPI002541CD35|nr:TPR repeat protein [Penicillium angulare]KAJ5273695.1 TPR repeat protein [Penicillium angulare]
MDASCFARGGGSSEYSWRMQKRLFLGGMGGIGKTQLAISLTKNFRGFHSSVFWLNSNIGGYTERQFSILGF